MILAGSDEASPIEKEIRPIENYEKNIKNMSIKKVTITEKVHVKDN